MLIRITNILSSEIRLFGEILELERKKRSAILSADGRKVQEITALIETLLFKISPLEEERENILKAEAKPQATVDSLIESYKTESPEKSEILRKKSAELKTMLTDMRTLIKENEELMRRTSDSIHRLLSGIARNADKQYSPVYMKSRTSAESVLLSTNA
jgi:hypothetical protein